MYSYQETLPHLVMVHAAALASSVDAPQHELPARQAQQERAAPQERRAVSVAENRTYRWCHFTDGTEIGRRRVKTNDLKQYRAFSLLLIILHDKDLGKFEPFTTLYAQEAVGKFDQYNFYTLHIIPH